MLNVVNVVIYYKIRNCTCVYLKVIESVAQTTFLHPFDIALIRGIMTNIIITIFSIKNHLFRYGKTGDFLFERYAI